MKRLFGFLLFIVGAVELVLTIAAIVAGGIQTIFVVSLVISVVLLALGVMLSYNEYEEELTEADLASYRKNGSIGERLGQL